MYAGCVSGAIEMAGYLEIIGNQGFRNVKIHKHKKIEISDEVLNKILSEKEVTDFRNEDIGIFSITVSGYKN
jgi:arsenite methyltransferase